MLHSPSHAQIMYRSPSVQSYHSLRSPSNSRTSPLRCRSPVVEGQNQRHQYVQDMYAKYGVDSCHQHSVSHFRSPIPQRSPYRDFH